MMIFVGFSLLSLVASIICLFGFLSFLIHKVSVNKFETISYDSLKDTFLPTDLYLNKHHMFDIGFSSTYYELLHVFDDDFAITPQHSS